MSGISFGLSLPFAVLSAATGAFIFGMDVCVLVYECVRTCIWICAYLYMDVYMHTHEVYVYATEISTHSFLLPNGHESISSLCVCSLSNRVRDEQSGRCAIWREWLC